MCWYTPRKLFFLRHKEMKAHFFQCLEDVALPLYKQGIYLGTSVTFGVAMYIEIYNYNTVRW
uniref:Uncharacterized protein n=1 Tax=Peromyscus maniculatus bairdii TaxID=230844 RepID=A0A8C8ULQ0_PERMB